MLIISLCYFRTCEYSAAVKAKFMFSLAKHFSKYAEIKYYILSLLGDLYGDNISFYSEMAMVNLHKAAFIADFLDVNAQNQKFSLSASEMTFITHNLLIEGLPRSWAGSLQNNYSKNRQKSLSLTQLMFELKQAAQRFQKVGLDILAIKCTQLLLQLTVKIGDYSRALALYSEISKAKQGHVSYNYLNTKFFKITLNAPKADYPQYQNLKYIYRGDILDRVSKIVQKDLSTLLGTEVVNKNTMQIKPNGENGPEKPSFTARNLLVFSGSSYKKYIYNTELDLSVMKSNLFLGYKVR